jgi:hypothetical protein
MSENQLSQSQVYVTAIRGTEDLLSFIYLFIHNCLCVLGKSTGMTPQLSFPPNLFLYVNLGAKGAQKLLNPEVKS